MRVHDHRDPHEADRGAGGLSGPLRRLAETARGIPGGRTAPLPQHGSPEVRELGDALSGLAKDLERQRRARRQLAQDLSHELKTPLMILRCGICAGERRGGIRTPRDGTAPNGFEAGSASP